MNHHKLLSNDNGNGDWTTKQPLELIISIGFGSSRWELSKLGEAIEMETCMEIMDLLYEEDTTYPLFTTSSHSLAAAILVNKTENCSKGTKVFISGQQNHRAIIDL